jgi:hypothetical protein
LGAMLACRCQAMAIIQRSVSRSSRLVRPQSRRPFALAEPYPRSRGRATWVASRRHKRALACRRGPNLRAEHGITAAVHGGPRELVRKSGFAANPLVRKVWIAIPIFSLFPWASPPTTSSGYSKCRDEPIGPFGQFWAMRNGSSGRYGSHGNLESSTCRSY